MQALQQTFANAVAFSLLLAVGAALTPADDNVPKREFVQAGLLEQAAAMRTLDAWVKEKDERQAQVQFTWDKAASVCKVTLTEITPGSPAVRPGKPRIVTTEAPDLPTAAKDALDKWQKGGR